MLYLKGMKKPTVDRIQGHDADQGDRRTTRRSMQDGRIVADGPAAANIPGVVAGLDYLYRTYGSGKVKWEDLVAPAITLADEGFILDEGLPSSIAEGRRFLEKWPEAAKIYLPTARCRGPAIASSTRTTRPRCARFRRAAPTRSIKRRDREEDRRRHGRERRHPDLRRPGAVSRDRARAGGGPLSRPHAVCGRPAAVDRHPAVRIAARARELPAEGRARARRRIRTTSTTWSSRGRCAIRCAASPIPNAGRWSSKST